MGTAALIVVLCATLMSFVQISSACNGYEMKLNSIKNCAPNSVIQLMKDFKVNLDKDCNVIVSGCVNLAKTIKTASAHYKVTKAPLPPIEGDVDMCELVEENEYPEVTMLLGAFGVTNKCPVQGGRKVCSTAAKMSIAKYKNQLGILAGTTDVRLDINHDNGGKTCAEMSITVKKK